MNETLSSGSVSSVPAWANKLAVFDTETTGLDLREARIVTACIAVIDHNGDLVAPAKEWLANPGIEIPEVASNVHGVTTEIAQRDGRDSREVVQEIVQELRDLFAQGIPVVAYNAPYDFTILYHEAIRNSVEPISQPMPVIDPLVIDKKVDWRKGKRKLEMTADYYQVKLLDAHNATADAIAAGRVAQAIAKKYAAKLSVDAAALHNLQVEWALEQDRSFTAFMQQNVDPNFKSTPGWPLKPTE